MSIEQAEEIVVHHERLVQAISQGSVEDVLGIVDGAAASQRALVRLVAAAIDYKDAYMTLYGDGEHTAQQVRGIDATEMELVAAVRALTGEEQTDG